MIKKFFEIAGDILSYLFDLRIVDIPLHIGYIAASFMIGYVSAMVLVGFPVAIWEHFANKKVNADIESKIIRTITVCITVAAFLKIIHENIT